MRPSACLVGLMLLSGLVSPHGQEAKPSPPVSLAPWVLHAKLMHEIGPEYPTVAGEKRVEGDAFVDLVVDENGKVQKASPVYFMGCSPILSDAAVAAVIRWEYQPTLVDGKPVPVASWVAFRFRSKAQPAVEILTRAESSTPAAEPPAFSGPQRLRVSSGVATSLLIHRVDPPYPLKAKSEHIEGDVVIQCIIDKDGDIALARILSGDDTLAQAVLKAIKQWKYKPFVLNGNVVEVETKIAIKFHLGH